MKLDEEETGKLVFTQSELICFSTLGGLSNYAYGQKAMLEEFLNDLPAELGAAGDDVRRLIKIMVGRIKDDLAELSDYACETQIKMMKTRKADIVDGKVRP